MRVFKFGGASVKDAEGVKNVAEVLKKVGYKDTLIIVSAMGKTTNALELVVDHYFNHPEELPNAILELKQFHLQIVEALFGSVAEPINNRVGELVLELKSFFKHNKSTNYSFVYDQVVGFGELECSWLLEWILTQNNTTGTSSRRSPRKRSFLCDCR